MSGHRAEALELYDIFFIVYESTTYGAGVFKQICVFKNDYADDVKNGSSLLSTTLSDIVVPCTR